VGGRTAQRGDLGARERFEPLQEVGSGLGLVAGASVNARARGMVECG
jgi:hypothetical protein